MLFRSRRWRAEITEMWQKVEISSEGEPRISSVRGLFHDARAIPAVLDFLRKTKVGKMPGLEVHGIQEEELGQDMELWADDGETSEEDLEREGGLDPP